MMYVWIMGIQTRLKSRAPDIDNAIRSGQVRSPSQFSCAPWRPWDSWEAITPTWGELAAPSQLPASSQRLFAASQPVRTWQTGGRPDGAVMSRPTHMRGGKIGEWWAVMLPQARLASTSYSGCRRLTVSLWGPPEPDKRRGLPAALCATCGCHEGQWRAVDGLDS